MAKTIKFVDSKETAPLRGAIGSIIGNLEELSGQIYEAKGLDIKPGLDIRQIPEYIDAVQALSKLREAAARKYHKENNIPL